MYFMYVSQEAQLCAGLVYGGYLTFSTWLLYFVATKTHFFSDSIKMYSLNDQVRM